MDKYNNTNIQIGIGLNKVDKLEPSRYFYQVIEDSASYQEIKEKLATYYQDKAHKNAENERECDLVSINIAEIFEDKSFVFSPIMLKSIHKKLFSGVFEGKLKNFVGEFRDYNIEKKEDILDGKSVIYGNYSEILEYLAYFELESKRDYNKLSKNEWVKNLSKFISNIWQIHPFGEGNTRTIAIFTIKYLDQKGISANNEIFKDNSLYFRKALVLANYGNIEQGIVPNMEYLEKFFEKLIINKEIH